MRGLLVLVLASSLACTPDLESVEVVRDLRVLAVAAEPPEAAIDLSTGNVAPVTVTVLATDPSPRAPLTASGNLCFPTDSERCDGVPSTPIGPARVVEEVPSWTLQVPPQVALSAIQQDDLKGFGGVRVQLSLDVADGDPHGPVFASKLLLFSPPGTDRNHNPRIASLDLTRDSAPAGTLQPGDRLPLRVGIAMGIRPRLADGEGGAETYRTVDLSGNTVTLTESPRYSFFTTDRGDLDESTADEPLPGTDPPDGLVRLTALSQGSGTFWIVVRDGRGGVGWLLVGFDATF